VGPDGAEGWPAAAGGRLHRPAGRPRAAAGAGPGGGGGAAGPGGGGGLGGGAAACAGEGLAAEAGQGEGGARGAVGGGGRGGGGGEVRGGGAGGAGGGVGRGEAVPTTYDSVPRYRGAGTCPLLLPLRLRGASGSGRPKAGQLDDRRAARGVDQHQHLGTSARCGT